MDVENWMGRILERIAEKPPNSPPFEVKELFTGDEWGQLTTGEKSLLGRTFAARVRKGDIDGVDFAPISKNGRHNKYLVY